MKGARLQVLKALENAKEDGLNHNSLVRLTGFSKSTISYVLERLIEEGVVVKLKKGRDTFLWLSRYAPSEKDKVVRVGFIKALEYAYLIPFSKLMRDKGIVVELKVYENGLSVLNDLAMGRIELAIAPLVTQILKSASTKGGVRIVAGAGRGGSSLISRKEVRRPHEIAGKVLGSTALSTMELNLLGLASAEGIAPEELSILHTGSAMEMLHLLKEGAVDAASLWEPYPTLMERKGYRRLVRYREFFDEFPCCVLSCRGSSNEEVLRGFMMAFETFEREKVDYGKAFSRLIGLPEGLVEDSIGDFTFRPDIDRKEVETCLIRAGMWGLIPIAKEAVDGKE